MVQAVRAITILKAGIPAIRALVRPYADAAGKDVDTISSIKPLEHGHTDDEKNILRLRPEDYKAVINQVQTSLKAQTGTSVVTEDIDYFPEPQDHKERVQNALKYVSDILARAYDRRTNMPSWILQLVLKKFGFNSDNFAPVGNILKDQGFVKVFSDYLRLKEQKGKAQADRFLESAFQGDSNKKQKQSLIKLSLFVMNRCDKLPYKFTNVFPVVFTLQNVSMPFLAKIFKEGFIGKLCDFMLLVNPWIGDFFAELVGNFKHEIHGIKGLQPHSSSLGTDLAARKVTSDGNNSGEKSRLTVTNDGTEIVHEVKLLELTPEEHNLQKTVKKVNDAFERLFGKGTTVSSWLLKGVLWWFGGHENYQKFAAEYVDKPAFIKKLYQHLKSGGKTKFDKHEERVVANIILGVVRVARSMSPEFIRGTSSVFGLPYSIQNLLMPILAKFVKEGRAGTLVHFLRDVNPLINDLFVDHIGNFRKEILDIQKEPIAELFPKLDLQLGIKKGLSNVLGYAKSLFITIRDFSKSRLGFSRG